jgi:hypothetical protein
MQTAKDSIKMIMERLGMNGTIAAKAMGMPDNTFRKKIMPSSPSTSFSEKNHTDLVDFLIEEVKVLILHKKEIEFNGYEYVVTTVEAIFTDYKSNKYKEEYNLFDEIVKVVNFMETVETFVDMSIYKRIINFIASKCELIGNDPNIFTIYKYHDYVVCDKKNDHSRWFDFMIYRRQQTINDILYG